MKTFLILPMLLAAILLACLFDSPSNAQNKSDQFAMPVASTPSTAPDAEATPAKTETAKPPYIYVLTTNNCAPCERLKGELISRNDRAKWLIRNHTVLLIKVNGFPAVMAGNGSQFSWPAECWQPDGSPLKALTDKLGYKKEKDKVGIKDLMKANADLVLSEASGVAQDVVCISPAGTQITVQGDFLEDDHEPLEVKRNAEKLPRTALLDLPRVISGITEFSREWEFQIDGETWQFNGFKGKDTNVQTVMLMIPGQEHVTGSSIRF